MLNLIVDQIRRSERSTGRKNSGTHAFEQHRAWLAQAGFAQARPLSERWLAVVKAEREVHFAGGG